MSQDGKGRVQGRTATGIGRPQVLNKGYKGHRFTPMSINVVLTEAKPLLL